MKFPMNRALMRGERKSERGVALAAFAVAMTGLLAFIPVAIDLGRLAHTANEVQTVADAAATAGAKALYDGGTASIARSHAQTVVAQNFIDGSGATIQAGEIEVGQYNAQTRTFVDGATPPSAVRATPNATVSSLFAAIFGSSQASATVTKTATAGFTGLGAAQPTLPLALGDCNFPALESCFTTSDCLPSLRQVPSPGDNTGWTSFTEGPTNPNTAGQYLPAACGGSKTPPVVSVGTSIQLNNGQGNVLKDIEDCVEKNGITEFLVPIVSCSGNFNQSSTVTGFATIVVSKVESKADPKGIDLKAIFKEVVGPPGGGAYGTGKMRLYS